VVNGRRLYDHRADVVALLVASPALWAPGLWSLALLVVILSVPVVRATTMELEPGTWGPASLVVLSSRLLLGIVAFVIRLLRTAIGILLAFIGGFMAVGVVAAGVGVLAGVIAHHDSGWLLWAYAQASIVAWAPRFGLGLAAFCLVRRRLIVSKVTDLQPAKYQPHIAGVRVALGSAFDEIGEVGLVGLAASTLGLVLLFSQLPLATWAPTSGYRSVASGLGLAKAVNHDLTEWVSHVARSALASCRIITNYKEAARSGRSDMTLVVLVVPVAGVAPSVVVAFTGARLVERVAPFVKSMTIVALTPKGHAVVTETFPAAACRDGVFRSAGAVAMRMTSPLSVTSGAAALAAALRSCQP
jgi:hypothetical protein